MNRVECQYCRQLIRRLPGWDDQEVVSHGVCVTCLPRLLEDLGEPLENFLDRLAPPVFLLQRNCLVLAANEAAREYMSVPTIELGGVFTGNVIGCKHAMEPGGCGGTVHCVSCAIRRSVTSTFETGEPLEKIPAYAEVGLLSGDRRIRFTISTRKVRDVVWLEIESVANAPSVGAVEDDLEYSR